MTSDHVAEDFLVWLDGGGQKTGWEELQSLALIGSHSLHMRTRVYDGKVSG